MLSERREAQTDIQGVLKKVTILFTCLSHNYLQKRLDFVRVVPIAFVDFNRQKIKPKAAMFFLPEEKVETILFWYENKR